MIRLAEKKDIENLLSLSETAFGKGFHEKKYFDKNDGECTVYTDKHLNILGYCMAIRTSKGMKISSVVVSEGQRGKGIATALIEDVLLEHPQEKVYIYAWRKGGVLLLQPVLNRLGFQMKEEKPKYWYRDSVERAYNCPECGNPCYCSAVIYEK